MWWINSIWLNENLNKKESYNKSLGESFDSNKYSEELATVGQEVKDARKNQLKKANELKNLLNDTEINSEKEKVENFIWEKCSEPIENVKKIMPYKDLVNLIIQSAKKEFDRVESSGYGKESTEYKNAFEVRNKLRLFTLSDEEKAKLSDTEKEQMKWLAQDPRIYELPAYKELINNWWFIIPSDIRTSYDSAGQKPVQHLWVDYNVKAWTQVKSIYKGKVVESCLDWWLWHKVIIEHEMEDWKKFYSLYGHIWSEWLPKIWDEVKKWDVIWKVGQAFTEENWNWEEHLHFQIMEDKDSKEWYSNPELWQIWNYDVLKAFRKE